MKIHSIFLWAFTSTVVLGCLLVQGEVSYDGRSILIDGKRRILISGSIHYPRSDPEMWQGLMQKAKEGGLDAIQTYVFWNGHEPSRGQYNFEGRYDLVRFLRTIQGAGLYAVLRLGPYVCAEWNFGGFPVWLKFEPNIRFRTDNEAFKNAMRGFTEKIVSLLKSEKLFASQGGPIILSQIENEYGGSLEARLGYSGYQYMSWAAKMAVEMGTGVPWLMCKQEDAPDPVINTCNGFYCEDFTANRPYKPKMWTEAWTSWFSKFGGTLYTRPVEDLAFAVANFIQKRGSYVNYYMFHGGTNFGRTAGGPFVTTSYDYDAPLDEYGYPRQPNWSHLRELHKAIKLSERALVSAEPTVISLGKHQQAHVYYSSYGCAAFLSNYDTTKAAKISFNDRRYSLPPWSISILQNCQDVIFNTAKVGVQTSRLKMKPTGIILSNWESYNEELTSMGGSSTFSTVGILDQINVTRDTTDYLWYTTTVNVHSSESFLHVGKRPTLVVTSAANVVYIFVNGKLCDIGSATRGERRFKLSTEVELQAGSNTISILSAAVGLQNIGTNFERWSIGVTGCSLLGLDEGNIDLTWQKWTYQVGLQGENMNLAYPTDLSPVDWTQNSLATQNRSPLTWYKASFNFDENDGDEALALDLKSMGKGQAWINGHSIGRYFLALAQGNCTYNCGYTGPYRPSKCAQGCGKPTQRMYHVPRTWLKPTGNVLVLLEELGGDPTKISLVKRTVASVCASVAEYHPNFKKWEAESGDHSQTLKKGIIAKARLQCNDGQLIKRIKFASYGTPLGTCGSYRTGSCHASLSRAIVEENCIGKTSCKIPIVNSYFGMDPCPSDLKRLSVEAKCG